MSAYESKLFTAYLLVGAFAIGIVIVEVYSAIHTWWYFRQMDKRIEKAKRERDGRY